MSGQYGEADRLMKELAEQWPSVKGIPRRRFMHALWRRDWAAARQLLASQPDGPEKKAWPALFDALESGNPARIKAAGLPFVELAKNPAGLSHEMVNALALAGYPEQAIAAVELGMSTYGMDNMSALWEPSFAQARMTPQFTALVDKTGLIDYWRMPGHAPDFCRIAPTPAICARLPRS